MILIQKTILSQFLNDKILFVAVFQMFLLNEKTYGGAKNMCTKNMYTKLISKIDAKKSPFQMHEPSLE